MTSGDNRCPPHHVCACGHSRGEHTDAGECADGIGSVPCECFGYECATDIPRSEDCCCEECQRGDWT